MHASMPPAAHGWARRWYARGAEVLKKEVVGAWVVARQRRASAPPAGPLGLLPFFWLSSSSGSQQAIPSATKAFRLLLEYKDESSLAGRPLLQRARKQQAAALPTVARHSPPLPL
jgi:hypothetical protein